MTAVVSVVEPLLGSAAPAATLRNNRGWVCPTLAVLILLLAFAPRFEAGGGAMDEGTVLVYPELVQHGSVPYRDFETFYGPANLWLLSGAYSLFGTHIPVERSVGLLYRLLSVLAIYAIARRWNEFVAITCMLISGFVLVATGVAAYAWMGAVACALWALWAASDVRCNSRCAGAGILVGWAMLFRVDLAPAVLLGTAPLLLAFDQRKLVLFVISLGFALLPLAVVGLMAGPVQLLNNLFVYPVLVTNPGRHLPLAAADNETLRLFVIAVVAGATNVVAGTLAFTRRAIDARGRLLVSIAIFAAGMSHQLFQRIDEPHVLCAGFASIAFLPLSIMVMFRSVQPLITSTLVAAVLAVCSWPAGRIVTEAFAISLGTRPVANAFVEMHGRSFPAGRLDRARVISRMLEQLDRLSRPGERLFVGPADLRRTNYCDTFIYHLMPQLRPASYFLEMNPGSANRRSSRLASDIATADWLVLDRDWDTCTEPNRSVEFASDAPNRVIADKFTFVSAFGSFGLFRHR